MRKKENETKMACLPTKARNDRGQHVYTTLDVNVVIVEVFIVRPKRSLHLRPDWYLRKTCTVLLLFPAVVCMLAAIGAATTNLRRFRRPPNKKCPEKSHWWSVLKYNPAKCCRYRFCSRYTLPRKSVRYWHSRYWYTV